MAMQQSPDVGQPQPNVGSLDIERAYSDPDQEVGISLYLHLLRLPWFANHRLERSSSTVERLYWAAMSGSASATKAGNVAFSQITLSNLVRLSMGLQLRIYYVYPLVAVMKSSENRKPKRSFGEFANIKVVLNVDYGTTIT